MANNYFQYSQIVNDLTDAEHAWLEEKLAWEPPEGAYDDREYPWPKWFDTDAEGIGSECELTPDSFWFYAEECGTVDTVSELLLEFIRQFRPDDVIRVTWASMCSKMRVGAFSGGAVVISREGIQWMDAGTWALNKKDEILAARKAP